MKGFKVEIRTEEVSWLDLASYSGSCAASTTFETLTSSRLHLSKTNVTISLKTHKKNCRRISERNLFPWKTSIWKEGRSKRSAKAIRDMLLCSRRMYRFSKSVSLKLLKGKGIHFIIIATQSASKTAQTAQTAQGPSLCVCSFNFSFTRKETHQDHQSRRRCQQQRLQKQQRLEEQQTMTKRVESQRSSQEKGNRV